jgi:hypothetical protein
MGNGLMEYLMEKVSCFIQMDLIILDTLIKGMPMDKVGL